MSVDQFEEAKEANQKMEIQQWTNTRKLAESWRYGIKPAKDRVESFNWQRRCNDSTCSFWLACLFLSNPTCFSPTYQLKSFRRICHKGTKKFLPFRIKEWLDCCMDVCSSYRVRQWYNLDLKGLLINQKLFLSTSEYRHYYQGRKWNMPEFLKSP